jgi:hypothetical protein
MLARLFSAAFLGAALSLTPVSPTVAEETEPYEIKRLIIGKKIVVDAEFAEKNEVAEPTPFEVTIPTGEDFLTLIDTKQGGFLKITFATPDREFLESIQFIDMKIPTDIEADRTAVVAKLMSERVFANVSEGREDAKVLAIRETEIGGIGAIEVIARYTEGETGLVYLWIVGMPHPVQARGTYAVAAIHHGRRPMETDEDFRKMLAGRALFSFRYLE